jgi:mono/diheme cytochrome c family protein/glucose/arabinose dehydrogenase
MKSLIGFWLTALVLTTALSGAVAPLVYEGQSGPGRGQHIVFLAGDHEYRSEETLPALARILAHHHGFKCTVLFTVDPATGEIAPGSSHLPGMEALATADLAVVYLRFQAFPPEQMKHFVAYLERGGPIVGLRTSTHAFKFPDDSPFVKYSTEYQGADYMLGFGHQVLGQTWIGHYGRNHQQSTRITPVEDKKAHPILRGVRDVWVQAGGYVGKPVSGEILTFAQPLQGMTPGSPADPAKPAMPSEWTRTYRSKSGQEARVFTSLYGASEDLLNEGYRRLLVNGIFWAVGQENAIRPTLNVSLVGPYQPTPFRNNGHRREVQPSELAGWDTPIMPAHKPIAPPTPPAAKKSPSTKKAGAAQKGQPKSGSAAKKWDDPWTEKKKPESATHAPDAEPPPASIARAQKVAPPAKGERIVFLGNGLAERDVYYSRMEAELHLRFPEHALLVRNMGRPGDTPAFRPHPARVSQWAFPGAEKFRPNLAQHNGKGFFSTPDQWLTHLKADTIVAFFGYNESFDGPGGVANYEAELDAFVRHTLTKAYNGSQAPRLVLVSPIAFENLSANRDLPDGRKENANLALYTEAMKRVAQTHRLTFIDLFHATRQRYAQGGRPFTINGFAPTEAAYQELGVMLAEGLFGPQPRASRADPAQVHAAVKQKDWFWNNDYNLVNGVHTHGQRYSPYGPQNYPDEVKKTREMMTLRDELIHAVASGQKNDLVVDDSKTHPLPPVPTNFAPSEKNGSQNILTGERAVRSFTVAPGYQVELFASEHEFPDLRNPVQMSFDNKGRLWVAVMPTYPHYRPGDPLPNDKLIILEDTDGDGRADKQTVFADGLHLPIGFEIAPEGVYVSQEPNLCLLVDDDGDDRADRMEYLLHGFDTHDTHHAISAYSADASGAFYLAEGRFLHSQVETPYGPRRVNDGGVWRFDPKSFRLERYSQADYSNPWGISFNRWEQMFISDASPGENWWGLPLSAKMPYGVEIPKVAQFVPKRSRPTSGAEFVSSRHFPDEQQGDFMICNSIGFLGISFGKVRDDGAGFTGDANGDLLSSSDGNFRPVDLEFAPDGSLYFIDWHNLLIGHMQHNARDPNRDRDHGRVYRITYPSRPLVTPAKIAGASIPELLENLKLPEYRTRYRTRRELRGRPADQVIPAVKAWAAKLDKTDPNYEHHLCEALWATWAQNRPDVDLLRQCLSARQPEARAAAASVLRFAHDKIPESTRLLMQAVQDEHPRVRLEAIVAASWLDNADGARIALEGLKQPLDRWMGPVTDHILKHTLKDDIAALQEAGQLPLEGNPIARDYLSGQFKIAGPAASAAERSYGPTRTLTADQRKIYDLGKQVYHRDAHCATCHQSNGLGMANVYPPLTDKKWLRDDERLIKLVLKGLWGPIEVNGERYDPTKGVPPMMGFAPLLNDEEMSAVLSYVRQSFGNDGEFVSPEQVKTVRDATKDRVNFYTAEELLQAHPFQSESSK